MNQQPSVKVSPRKNLDEMDNRSGVMSQTVRIKREDAQSENV